MDILNINFDKFVKMVLSKPKPNSEYNKIEIKPVITKNNRLYQLSCFKGDKVYHKNLDVARFDGSIAVISAYFKNIDVFYTDKHIFSKESKKGKVSLKSTVFDGVQKTSHNRTKNYILKEGLEVKPLVDLGVFTRDYKLVKSKSDKYRQINRFVEIIQDELKTFDKKEITILDFGCGKSYLTFILYYYLTEILEIHAKIIGYDLKEDVVKNCNDIAEKYGYSGIKFVVGDVSKIDKVDDVDMLITLHACDTATDYALHSAIKNNIKYVFSVPCCQHEINENISIFSEYKLLTNHGLIKERFSALLTDSIRCEVLRCAGYDVDVLEFVDFSHSPKNLMIRAKKVKVAGELCTDLEKLIKEIGTSQELYKLYKEENFNG
ncbi:MAG: SAM-dependent methyltransferase [Defluviitaleaceae bacterium]|nr:SAM-dependent methyltransferase [Defluviitaleaceae bacterium]